ncbi:hypothetical protein L5515_009538 [Caenorhabditis briggsae]|uniref:Uncharacterized protein n=1 Tax=Caenorhabditis briggsae TaxID=6238 RepID=A0AAE9FA24_CAEBR|nr:hypothetical protein L5515_009538 [Caenorhabditis briggsae]
MKLSGFLILLILLHVANGTDDKFRKLCLDMFNKERYEVAKDKKFGNGVLLKKTNPKARRTTLHCHQCTPEGVGQCEETPTEARSNLCKYQKPD